MTRPMFQLASASRISSVVQKSSETSGAPSRRSRRFFWQEAHSALVLSRARRPLQERQYRAGALPIPGSYLFGWRGRREVPPCCATLSRPRHVRSHGLPLDACEAKSREGGSSETRVASASESSGVVSLIGMTAIQESL